MRGQGFERGQTSSCAEWGPANSIGTPAKFAGEFAVMKARKTSRSGEGGELGELAATLTVSAPLPSLPPSLLCNRGESSPPSPPSPQALENKPLQRPRTRGELRTHFAKVRRRVSRGRWGHWGHRSVDENGIGVREGVRASQKSCQHLARTPLRKKVITTQKVRCMGMSTLDHTSPYIANVA